MAGIIGEQQLVAKQFLEGREFYKPRTEAALDLYKQTPVSKRKKLAERLLKTSIYNPYKKGEDLKKILQEYRNVGIGDKCGKAEGGRIGYFKGGSDKCMRNAMQEHNRKLKEGDFGARKKQIKLNQTKNIKNILSLGTKVARSPAWLLGGRWGALLEAVIEGGVYEYFREQGQSHEEARENLFFPKIAAKYAPKLWEKLGFEPFETGLLGGPEEKIKKELYEIRGTEKENLGKVIGERESVKRYIDNENALYEAQNKYGQLFTDYNIAATGRERNPEKAERLMTALEVAWEEMNTIEDQLDLDRDMYQAAVEKQETERGKKAIEYGTYGTGDTERLAKEREERRQKAMDEKFPGYGKNYIDQMLEDKYGVYIDPNLRSYKGRTTQRPQGLKYIGKSVLDPGYTFTGKPALDPKPTEGWSYDEMSDWLKNKEKTAYFAENFRTEKAGGGIAGIRRPNAVPPESGPMPQGGGLSTMFNRVKPW